MKLSLLAFSATALSLCFASFSSAQSPSQNLQRALSYCSNLDQEAKTNCRRDAQAAYSDNKRHPQSPQMNHQRLEQNRLLRCQDLPAQEQTDCKDQMTGQHQTQIYGSVEGGGILRQTTIEIPAKAQ